MLTADHIASTNGTWIGQLAAYVMSPNGRSIGFVSSFQSEGASREVKSWQEDVRGMDAWLSATLPLPLSFPVSPWNPSFASPSITFQTLLLPFVSRCCLSLSLAKNMVFKIQIGFAQWPIHPAEYGLWSAIEQTDKKEGKKTPMT